jgi:alpha-D-ribose 1-methylphosphonate 5-triphosphate synthase subunit PhnI
MYVAVKGGERAIENSHRLLASKRRGPAKIPEVRTDQIEAQLGLAVDRVMTEGALYDRRLAALALKQAQGDQIEAIFLVRAFRTTLPRFGYSRPIDTGDMHVHRRVSAAFKDLPGGQVLGPTYDYTHRLIDFALEAMEAGDPPEPATGAGEQSRSPYMPRIAEILEQDGMIAPEEPDSPACTPGDLTRDPLQLPASRDARLQNLVRGDEGFLLSVGYSLQRGFGLDAHPFLGEIRHGEVVVEFTPPELGFTIEIGILQVTESVMVNRFEGSADSPPQFIQGYGLTFGHCERKAMAMSMVDRSLRAAELGETIRHPAQDEEFVLSHSDNVEASGFVQHLKLPHHVDFQSERVLLRKLQAEYETQRRQTDQEAN